MIDFFLSFRGSDFYFFVGIFAKKNKKEIQSRKNINEKQKKKEKII